MPRKSEPRRKNAPHPARRKRIDAPRAWLEPMTRGSFALNPQAPPDRKVLHGIAYENRSAHGRFVPEGHYRYLLKCKRIAEEEAR